MINCRQIRDDFGGYIDRSLAEAATANLEAHLAGCADCRKYLHDLLKVSDALKDIKKLNAPQDFLVQVKTRVEPRRSPLFLLGLAVVVIFVFILIYRRPFTSSNGSVEPIIINTAAPEITQWQNNSVKTSAGEPAQALLAHNWQNKLVESGNSVINNTDSRTLDAIILKDSVDIVSVTPGADLSPLLQQLEALDISVISMDTKELPYLIMILTDRLKLQQLLTKLKTMPEYQIPTYEFPQTFGQAQIISLKISEKTQ